MWWVGGRLHSTAFETHSRVEPVVAGGYTSHVVLLPLEPGWDSCCHCPIVLIPHGHLLMSTQESWGGGLVL